MPMAFPPTLRGNPFDRWKWQRGAKPPVQFAPNLARPGVAFGDDQMSPGLGLPISRPNVRSLGAPYSDVQRTAVVSPASELRRAGRIGPGNPRVFLRMLGNLRMTLSGVTRDSSGQALGSVTVMVFRTEDRSFITQTVSDATTGEWAMDLLVGGPFFTVDYLVGVPDRAGTSVNTLVPTQNG